MKAENRKETKMKAERLSRENVTTHNRRARQSYEQYEVTYYCERCKLLSRCIQLLQSMLKGNCSFQKHNVTIRLTLKRLQTYRLQTNIAIYGGCISMDENSNQQISFSVKWNTLEPLHTRDQMRGPGNDLHKRKIIM